MMMNETIEKSDEVVWQDFSFAIMRLIYTVGLFIIFLSVSNIKIRAVCVLTMTLPTFAEFVCKKLGSRFFKI